jgi:hypothetical protein
MTETKKDPRAVSGLEEAMHVNLRGADTFCCIVYETWTSPIRKFCVLGI